MPRLPIVDALLKYKEEENSYFAMPGHKMGKAYEDTKEGKILLDNFIKFDITEVEGLDNLHNPTSIIKEGQEQLANYYGCKKSYFLVNGSTSGNMIMIFATFKEGDKIIVERNCHRSVFNSIILRKLKPIYVMNEVSEKYDASFSISKKHLFKLIKENQDARGILLTYPNYYGICTELEEIVKEAKKYNMKVLIDCAHGAHFGVIDELPDNPLKLGCDMVVQSAHKTLPSLTQTSFLHVNCDELLDEVNFYTSMFLTTSPSYLFLASMDYSRYYLQKYGSKDYGILINLCEEYRRKINLIGFYHIIDEHDIIKKSSSTRNKVYIDKTRYVINVPKGFSGHLLLDYLKVNKIQCEMSDSRNVVLIFATSNTRDDFDKLYRILKECNKDTLVDEYVKPMQYEIPLIDKLPWETLNMKKVECSIKDSVNKVCGQAIVPYPPGVPLIMPGEIITKDIIDIIGYYIDNNVTLLGVKENNLIIIK
ncbi:decarboxylase [Clostridium sulfidigenes]|uniref:Decarboxylase n=1 Tax=Clostridium sulfidigenes TaxID=318464 RepID=A0A084JF22_9CLOT|nr:aminotransferase class V-fold PLP-dependent enzyme [Clostridium sulfidigenes]KEZ87556.1 decarboxylase [Clostridium sulfidigenes]